MDMMNSGEGGLVMNKSKPCPANKDEDLLGENSFFDSGGLKNIILNKYKDLLCRQMFESAPIPPQALQESMVQGLIISLVRVYVIESVVGGILPAGVFNYEEYGDNIISIKYMINKFRKDIYKNDASLYQKIADYASTIIDDIEDRESRILENRSPIFYLFERELKRINIHIKDMLGNIENTEEKILNLFNTELDTDSDKWSLHRPPHIEAKIDIPYISEFVEHTSLNGQIPFIGATGLNAWLGFSNSGVFVLEPYIRIIDKEEAYANNRDDDLYGYVNIDKWNDYIEQEASSDISEFVKNNFEKMYFGTRLKYLAPFFEAGDEAMREEIEKLFSPDVIYKTKSLFRNDVLSTPFGTDSSKSTFHFPLAQIEKEIVYTHGSSFSIDLNKTDSDQGFVHTSTTLSSLRDYEKNLAYELSKTDDYKFLFEYIFPVKQYLSVARLYTMYGLFDISTIHVDNMFSQTKKSILNAIETVQNSAGYAYQHPAVVNASSTNSAEMKSVSTRGFGPGPEIAKMFALKTPFLILKGFVELTDPAIMTAQKTIDIGVAAATAANEIAREGLKYNHSIVMEGIRATEQQLSQLSGPLYTAESELQNIIDSTSDGAVSFAPGTPPDAVPVLGPSLILTGDIPSTDSNENEIPDIVESDYPEITAAFINYRIAKRNYTDINKSLVSSREEAAAIKVEIDASIAEAENIINDVADSPYTLPATVMAMMPSAVPYFAGFPPPPIGPGVGPPLTIPGLIYLISAFALDDYEQSQEDSRTKNDEDCT